MQNALLSAETLLKKKDIIKKYKNEKLDIEIEEIGTFRFKVPTDENLSSIEGLEPKDQDAYLVYACCESPNLKDENLQKEFGGDLPFEIVKNILKGGDIKKIVTELLNASGYNETKLKVEKVKN